MAVTLYTEQQLLTAALDYFRATFPRVDLSDRSFFGLLARAFAQFFVLAQYAIEQCDFDSVPAYQQDADGNVRSRCSSEALDAWAFVFGLASGVPGVYGRRGATVATGGLVTPGVSLGSVVLPAGSQATDQTGTVTLETLTAVVLSGPPNTVRVQLRSVTKGAAANLPLGSTIIWTSPPAGLNGTAVLQSALEGAEDQESDAELVARILRRIQQPPRGGTAADYRAWAEESVDADGAPLNIAQACSYPLRSGLGSVDQVVLYKGSGLGRRPPNSEIAKVQAYLNRMRPVTAAVKVLPPLMPASSALRIRVRATPSGAKNGTYRYDWNDGGVSTTITAHTSNTFTVTSVPVDLLVAFNSGGTPRVQFVISTAGASPVPFVARVTQIAVNVLTIDTPFPVAPTDGVDYFWAGSSVVVPVATRILEYIDSLGPSRQSGFGDPNDAWDDQVRLERITDVVLETRDTDATRMIIATPGFGASSVQIAVGAGAFAPAPYAPRDVGTGIELAYVRSGGIEVIQ